MSSRIFTNLQKYGTIYSPTEAQSPESVHTNDGDHESVQDDDDSSDNERGSPAMHEGMTAINSTADAEAHLLLNDTEAYALLAQHFITTEGPYWQGYRAGSQPAPTAPPSPFDSPSQTTKRLALDLLTGDVIDAKGYVFAGENLLDINARDSLIARALVKALKTRANTGDASARNVSVKAIALLRNPKTLREALSSPEWSKWIAAIHAEMSS